jgi:hypothetical protein
VAALAHLRRGAEAEALEQGRGGGVIGAERELDLLARLARRVEARSFVGDAERAVLAAQPQRLVVREKPAGVRE